MRRDYDGAQSFGQVRNVARRARTTSPGFMSAGQGALPAVRRPGYGAQGRWPRSPRALANRLAEGLDGDSDGQSRPCAEPSVATLPQAPMSHWAEKRQTPDASWAMSCFWHFVVQALELAARAWRPWRRPGRNGWSCGSGGRRPARPRARGRLSGVSAGGRGSGRSPTVLALAVAPRGRAPSRATVVAIAGQDETRMAAGSFRSYVRLTIVAIQALRERERRDGRPHRRSGPTAASR